MMDKFLVVILFVCVGVANAGEYCKKYHHGSMFSDSFYCSTSCCGGKYNRYCCSSVMSHKSSNVGLVWGIVLGVIGLIAVIVTVLVAVFCCCRRTTGRTGQVCQPPGVTTTVPVYGVQTTTVGYGQVGYTNMAFPQQLPVTNMPGTTDNSERKWQEPPPPYTSAVAN